MKWILQAIEEVDYKIDYAENLDSYDKEDYKKDLVEIEEDYKKDLVEIEPESNMEEETGLTYENNRDKGNRNYHLI